MRNLFVKLMTLGAAKLGLPMASWRAKSSAKPSFGIDDLPDGMGVLPCGHPVAFVAQPQPAVDAWLPALFKDALATGPVFLVAEDPFWVDQLLTDDTLQNAFVARQLNILLTRHQTGTEIQQQGLQCIFEEWDDHGLDANQTILWVGAHAWLHTLNLGQLQKAAGAMRHWSAKRKNPVVFIFLKQPDAGDFKKELGKMFGFFPSLAMLSFDRNWPTLSLERWNSDKGAVFELNFGLNQHVVSHRLSFNGCLTHGSMQDIVEAPDKDVVIATQASVAGQRNIPGNWRILGHAGEGALAVANSVAATVVLHAGSINDFGILTRVVHHLRMTHPRSLKIVVRENDAKLRVNIERALIHLGANLIVYREIGFARLIQMIRDINDQTFAGELNADYDTALSSFKPDIESGYVTPAKFCETIINTLTRTESSGMTHTLVQLHILPIIPHVDAINACTVFRDGDLVTADTEILYVFLFACAETDVDSALARLFTVPVAQLFSSQVTDSSADGIQIILARLHKAARKGLPDYSAEIRPSSNHVDSVAFNGKRLPSYGGSVEARLPLLDSAPVLPAPESPLNVQAPTFRPRVIGRQTRSPSQAEQTV